ncbi:MAG: glycosyltransferase family 2 protein [Phycisphaerae bacterium]|nr:glycosyltransferase family 2 protein [Phycisphaerae bacterium]
MTHAHRPIEVPLPEPKSGEASPRPKGGAGGGAEGCEVTFVMPCLNEARTLEGCIRAARRCIDEHRLDAEIVIGDNGSTDGSQDLARRCGARVIDVPAKGYGSALRGAIEAARGRFIIMADSDQSYDFGEGFKFVAKLREGFDLVMGCRMPRGGGSIDPGAMPWKHRWIGNPILTRIGQVFYRTPINDFHCGLRGFTKAAYEQMALRTTGMEFASEMVIKASLRRMRVAEVPITLHKDGRDRPPHLRSWRDGWRHLRFMLCLSPRWTLLIPGLVLCVLGAVLGAAVWMGPLVIAPGVALGIHSMVAASLMLLVGFQLVTVAVAMRIFALEEEIGPPSPGIARLFNHFTLERGVLVGSGAALIGLALIGIPLLTWIRSNLGEIRDPLSTLRPMVAGATLVALGVQAVLMSFVYSMMGIKRR